MAKESAVSDREGVSSGDSSGGTGGVEATVELAVGGMHCSSCSALLEEVLGDHPGVASAWVELDAAKAKIDFDPSAVTVEELVALIAAEGYSAELAG
jgi:Cu+-exporting ATPase